MADTIEKILKELLERKRKRERDREEKSRWSKKEDETIGLVGDGEGPPRGPGRVFQRRGSDPLGGPAGGNRGGQGRKEGEKEQSRVAKRRKRGRGGRSCWRTGLSRLDRRGRSSRHIAS